MSKTTPTITRCTPIDGGELRNAGIFPDAPVIQLAQRSGDRLPRIEGFAVVYNSLSHDLGGFCERILPGACREIVSSGAEMLALVNHDTSFILGRRSAGTLRIREESRGLFVSIDPPDTTIGRDAVENVQRQDIKGMSFRFADAKDSWSTENGQRIRTISRIGRMLEVTLTAIPAYPATTADIKRQTPALDLALKRMQLEDLERGYPARKHRERMQRLMTT